MERGQTQPVQSLDWRKRNVGGRDMRFWAKKRPKFGTLVSPTLGHGHCHSGTGLWHHVTKVETRVQRDHTKVLRALNRPKWRSGGRDISFCLNVGLMSGGWRKGLRRERVWVLGVFTCWRALVRATSQTLCGYYATETYGGAPLQLISSWFTLLCFRLAQPF